MTFHSPFLDVEIPDSTLTPFVLRHAGRLADKPAVIDAAGGGSITYGALARDVRRFAAGLQGRGFRKGDVLAVLSPNLSGYPVAFHGAATAGAVVTTLNPLYTADEIGFQLRDSGARILLTIGPLLDKARQAAAKSSVEEIVVFGEAEDAIPFAALLADGEPQPVDLDPARDVVVLPYSSGTTGFSKGVMLTHRNLVANLLQATSVFPLAEDDIVSAFLPFFHIYGMNVIMNSCLCQGASLVTMPRFELEPFLKSIQDHRITRLYLVPPVVLLLAKSPIVDRYDLGSVRFALSGAAPLDDNIARLCQERTGIRVTQGYGLTETSPVTHGVPPNSPRIALGSIGPLAPNTECKIVDVATGLELGTDRDGELWIRGPQVMKGYLNNDEATRSAIDAEGYFHTGDIGHVDDQGNYYIVDRVKELIKYKGYQVPPAELEAHVLSHPKVADAAVIGVLDDEGEEIPKAYVVAKEPLTAEELIAFVAERVAPYKKIRRVEFVEQIPKSPTGKILRRILRERERAGAAG